MLGQSFFSVQLCRAGGLPEVWTDIEPMLRPVSAGDGTIEGVLDVVAETTGRVIG